jgi:hypothetical protein
MWKTLEQRGDFLANGSERAGIDSRAVTRGYFELFHEKLDAATRNSLAYLSSRRIATPNHACLLTN